jgi:hypothetical protein
MAKGVLTIPRGTASAAISKKQPSKNHVGNVAGFARLFYLDDGMGPEKSRAVSLADKKTARKTTTTRKKTARKTTGSKKPTGAMPLTGADLDHAFQTLMELMHASESDTVRMTAAKTIIEKFAAAASEEPVSSADEATRQILLKDLYDLLEEFADLKRQSRLVGTKQELAERSGGDTAKNS